ncbi:protein COFACTOR ASSEMBLY OF COMPLEX C SUBUNIT B CCB3, chloroplastic isoform X2 [Carica papaya]|uniref:protein COFACTOR ASSEMBLY OF COMPLEX C SUBUNIT B CCB3, chloroplastic isoform X2 n=1 Tax=Carica papaya TaxID=3649 RepID=UPI000B8D005A|nr:protein COFACTOR ASSEMBLY OF COMPLEX C SUBUNIT B CCB3, chloroplastic isoform X2 [Carica papaya]
MLATASLNEGILKHPPGQNPGCGSQVINYRPYFLVAAASFNLEPGPSYAVSSSMPDVSRILELNMPSKIEAVLDFIQNIMIADLDPATAKSIIGILGPLLSAFAFLFILRIVMSWYPKLPVGKFPYVIAYAPTEPLLVPTRKLIPPVGGVDVTPVVWFGLLSFLNEILLGPQGLLVLISQKVS